MMWIPLLVLAVMTAVSPQAITAITVNTETNGTLKYNQTAYYSVTLPSSLDSDMFLIATVDTEDSYSAPEIYLSDTQQYPSYSNADQDCLAQKIGSCARTNLTPNSTIYIGVRCNVDCSYTLFVALESTVAVNPNSKYMIIFGASESAVITFELDDSYSEFVILAEDQDFYASDQYRMLLGVGFVPSENNYSLKCKGLGPFRKAIKIESDLMAPNTTYYVLVEASKGTNITFDTQGLVTGEQGLLFPNTTKFDYLEKPSTYSVSYPLSNESVSRPLYIRLKSYSGYGQMTVTYCGNQYFNYFDMDGENEEIRISPADRLACMNSLTGLLVENVGVSVEPLFGDVYSFSIGTHESSYTEEVRFTELESAVLGPSQISNYTLWLYLTQPTNITLNVTVASGNPTFFVYQCVPDSQNCISHSTLSGNSSTVISYNPSTCTGKCFILLNAVGGTQESQFSFIFKALGYKTILDEGIVDTGFVSMNQYVYYNLTLTNPVNVTSVTLKLVKYSGDVVMVTSQSTESPIIDDVFTGDAIMAWNNVITYSESLDQPIYVGVFGQSEAVYKIVVNVDREQNTPSSYTTLEDQVTNDFTTITSSPLLVKYTPHINPYYISFYPSQPSCISFGNTLPLSPTCMDLPESFSGPIFLNITSIPSTSIKITVSTDIFLLSESNPLFLTCDDDCYEDIQLSITNFSQRIIHSGYGTVYYNATNTTLNNGALNITCPNNQTSCVVNLTAKLSWGSMIVSIASSDITEISWYPTAISLSKLPKKLVYLLPKDTPSVITIVSRVASVDIYANIEMLDSTFTNSLNLSYPDRTNYDLKVQSDPFKRTTSLEVTNELLSDIGCSSDNEVCLLTLTVYLNQNSRYSNLLAQEIMVVSSSSYTMKMQENVRYLMEDASDIEYFEYSPSFSSNFTFMVEAVSNCKPLLIYSNSTEYPTSQISDIQDYHQISVSNSVKAVVGVINEEDCIYNMIVVVDDNTKGYRQVVEGFPETINLQANSTTYLYYTSPTALPFQIYGTFNQLSIYVKKVPNGSQPTDFFPNKTYYDYSSSSLPLTIPSTQPSSYIIALTNLNWKNVSTSLLVTQSGLEVIMVHNRMYKQATQEGGNYSFRYYSAESFRIVFVTSSGELNVSVTSYGDSVNVTQQINDSSVYPTVDVKGDGELRPYFIVITASTIGNFTMEVIDTGGEGSPTLSSGIPFFDSFTENPQTSCYQFRGDPISTDPIRVSLIYQDDFIAKLSEEDKNLQGLEITMTFDYSPFANTTSEKPALRNYLYFSSGITLSIEQMFGLYTFCFENTAQEAVDQPYYVVIASKDLQFLIPSLSFFVSDSKVQLDKYELIATQPKTLLAELMNCDGETQLTGASTYPQILSGSTTEIHDTFVNGPYFLGMVNVSKGYYYLGVKAIQPNSSYVIRFTTYPQTAGIVLSQMAITNPTLKWHGQGNSLVVTVDSLKCIGACNHTRFLRYLLYIGDNAISTSRRARCGLSDSGTTTMAYQSIQTNFSNTNATFRVPLINIPDQFVLTVKAEAWQLENDIQRPVYYFYTPTSMLQADDIVFVDDEVSWPATILSVIILGLVLVLFVLCVCKRFKVGMFRQNVEFQVTDFTSNSREPEHDPYVEDEREAPPEIELKEVQRRETPEGIPYGEFIDESRI